MHQSLLKIAAQLRNDENGFLISAELVLIATLAVLTLIVGLSEVSSAVHNELRDVARGFTSANQDGPGDGGQPFPQIQPGG